MKGKFIVRRNSLLSHTMHSNIFVGSFNFETERREKKRCNAAIRNYQEAQREREADDISLCMTCVYESNDLVQQCDKIRFDRWTCIIRSSSKMWDEKHIIIMCEVHRNRPLMTCVTHARLHNFIAFDCSRLPLLRSFTQPVVYFNELTWWEFENRASRAYNWKFNSSKQ